MTTDDTLQPTIHDKYGHWDTSLIGEFDSSEWYGFLYCIKNTINGVSYIGKKNFKFLKSGKKINGRRSRKYIESDWKQYTGSCVPLNEDIDLLGLANFRFYIIKLCSGKAELSYSEERLQFSLNVLFETLEDGNKAYYNRVIGHRHFNGVASQSEQTKIKQSKSSYFEDSELQKI